ncbi:aldehyde dehydrogenase family protein [Sphingomonas sp. C8-2]|nr:aldehyde dehydrogenase family protein [Sphingomonas sp. C8-2]
MTIQKNLVAGQWTGGSDLLEIRNPSNIDELVGRYGTATADDVKAAYAAGRAAQPEWRFASPERRSNALEAIASAIFARKDELAQIMSREGGKTLPDALGEIVRASNIARFFAGEALRMGGEKLPSVRPDVDVEITREPVGAVGLITPWNFPIAVPLWKIAPALAFGNAIIWKPSEKVPAISIAIAEIIEAAGLPSGLFNMVLGTGAELGGAIIAGADAVSFTGSSATGRKIAVQCAERLIRCQMEMGGKNPLVVVDDANVELAADIALNGAFFQVGQRCTASSRLIVTAGIHDAFSTALAERVAALRVGHAGDANSQLGPVIDQSQFDKNLSYATIGRDEGAKLVAGGNALKLDNPGWYVAPTLFADTDNSMRINREEVFGPFATIIRARDYEEALNLANDTDYGLSAGIVTTSMKIARHFQAHSQAGMTMLNLPTAGVDYHVPFGGRKQSSFGPREQGRYAIEFYTIVKTSYLSA